MFRLIDWIVILSEAGLLIALKLRLGEILGGSLCFLVVIPICVYFSYIRKVYQEQLSRLALAALALVGLNVLASLERRGAVERLPILITYTLISLVFLNALYHLTIAPIRVPRGSAPGGDPIRIELIKKTAAVYILMPTAALLMYAVPGGLIVWIGQASNLVKLQWISVTTLSIFWQAIGAAVHSAFLKRITDGQVAYLLKGARRLPVPKFKSKVGWSLLFLFLLGSGAEVARGLWFFWMGSFLFWTLTLANAWKVWKHIFSEELMEEPAGEASVAYNILEDFWLFLYSALVAAVSGIGLAALLGLTSPRH